jgi:hypothetical protein
MLYVDMPTAKDIATLNEVRADACVSIFFGTTPLSEHAHKMRLTFESLMKRAMEQLEVNQLDKRRASQIRGYFDDLLDDDEFWDHQAHSLAIFATPDRIRTFRLANRLTDIVQVADRFHIKPLLRAVTHSQSAYVLAVSENAVRLIAVSGDTEAQKVRVPDMPKDAASAVGKASINDRSASGRVQGSEGQKVRLAQYVRQIEAALRPVVSQSDTPVVLAATQPVAALVRSVSSLNLLPQTIEGSPDDLSESDLARAARPILDANHANEIKAFAERFAKSAGAGKATGDISDAARAATFGAIDTLLVDIDSTVPGTVDDKTGTVTFADRETAHSYGIVDEIVGRALRTGARVMAVRRDDIPGKKDLAAILRNPL